MQSLSAIGCQMKGPAMALMQTGPLYTVCVCLVKTNIKWAAYEAGQK